MLRRAIVLGLAVGVAWPAAAEAAVKFKVRESPAEVRAYWTADRMQSARPLRIDRGKGGKPGGGGGGDATSSWTSFEAPLDASGRYADPRHGKVFFSDGTYNYVCSGTALSRDVVWTAGHCVVEGGGGVDRPYTKWAFVPAYRDGARPFGTFPSTVFAYTGDWDQSREYGHDFAGASVAANEGGQTLNALVGGFGLAYDYAGPTETSSLGTMESHGYPAERKFNGERQNVCRSSVIRRDIGNPPTLAINCDSNGGSSGGGWINERGLVASVNSYGYRTLKDVMFGPAHDSAAKSVYDDAAAR